MRLPDPFDHVPHRAPLREASVKIWGFRGPLGAFIAAWGGVAMITSAPFDDWWHNAYGLDVKILSPPHVLLIIGMVGVQLGALILILGQMNRVTEEARAKLEWLFLYVGAMIVVCIMILIFEYELRPTCTARLLPRGRHRHTRDCWPACRGHRARRWAASIVIGIYSLFLIGCVWILPLFPAAPKLGPVYQQRHALRTAGISAAADRARRWRSTGCGHARRTGNRGSRPLVSGPVFVALIVAVQWPFATFLMSPASRNWVFGTIYFDYNLRPNDSLRTPSVLRQWKRPLADFWMANGVARWARRW